MNTEGVERGSGLWSKSPNLKRETDGEYLESDEEYEDQVF